MLEYLYEVEKRLPSLLNDVNNWTGRLVTYEKPYVERLFMQDGENRIYLHKIHTCNDDEAYYHEHPWPSAMKLLSGKYKMNVGFGDKVATSIILAPGSYYEMSDLKAKHSVQPLTPSTLSVMVTGPVWSKTSVKQKVNPDLPEEYKAAMFKAFKKFYPLSFSRSY